MNKTKPMWGHVLWSPSTEFKDDVKSLNTELTKEECREVLEFVKNSRDAEIGLNGAVIGEAINVVWEGRNDGTN